jgi:two-component system phosphate regulon sensor histidine kinase PhoR
MQLLLEERMVRLPCHPGALRTVALGNDSHLTNSERFRERHQVYGRKPIIDVYIENVKESSCNKKSAIRE